MRLRTERYSARGISVSARTSYKTHLGKRPSPFTIEELELGLDLRLNLENYSTT